jgi:hypothetical protein
MTAVRRQQIMSAMLDYMTELIDQDEEIYNVLHGAIGMTHEEIHECGIDYLDDYFQAESDSDRLMQKIESRYQALRSMWSKMTPEQILNNIDEVFAATAVYRILTRRGVSEDDASWLVRFRNPLIVVSDEWQQANDIDCFICEERLDVLITDLRDRGDAESNYVMDDEPEP